MMKLAQALRVGAALLLPLCLAGLWLLPANRPWQAGRSPDRFGDDVRSAYPPPPPPPPAPATATPPPDPAGYLPPPGGIEAMTIRLADGPYAELLEPLQRALAAGDTAWLVAVRHGERSTFGAALASGHGGRTLGPPEFAALLAQSSADESRPVVQGYFVAERTAGSGPPCLAVLLHGFQGSWAVPTTEPTDPLADAAARVEADAAIWRFCRDNPSEPQPWYWLSWTYGGYHKLVEQLLGVGYRPPYRVVRP